MSSVDSQERRFNPYEDLATFYAGIQVAPLTTYKDSLIAANILRIQMDKLHEEVGEVRFASGPEHQAEELIDVAYVAIGISCILDNPPTEIGAQARPPADHLDHVVAIEEIHAAIRDAHENGQHEALGEYLAGLASISFGLVEALGYSPEELWGMKHVVNITKYDAKMYTELRTGGMSHEEAIDSLKASWPERRLKLDANHLPIDMSNGHLVV